MGKYKTFLLTEAAEVIFHATHAHRFAQMIKDDAIKLTMSTGADSTVNRGKYYYLSAMRGKYGRYATGPEGKWLNNAVVIDLDGHAISNVAKIKGTDYWGKDFHGVDSYREEQEERVMSDKPTLAPLSKFINEVHVYVDTKEENKMRYDDLFYINDNYARVGIKVYFYKDGDEQAFKSQRKEKAVTDLNKIVNRESVKHDTIYKVTSKYEDGSIHVSSGLMTKAEADEYAKEVGGTVITQDEADQKEIKNTSSDEKYIADFLSMYRGEKPKFKYGEYVEHGAMTKDIAGIEAAIHNLKFKHDKILEEVVNEMKKAGYRNVNEFLKFAQAKIWEHSRG